MSTPTREIVYDPETRDFACYLDGELAGFARTWQEGEAKIDEQLARRAQRSGLDLDAANAEIAACVAGYEPDAEERAEVAAWLAALDEEAEAGAGYALPRAELVAEALAELSRVAEQAGDAHNARALGRAAAMIAAGLYGRVGVAEGGALLVPSQRPGEAGYTVGDRGCSCPAGAHGRPCAHSALAEGVTLAREWATAQLDDRATYWHDTQTISRMAA